MRIALDLQGAQTASRFRGIGRYSLAFAKALVRNGGTHQITIVLSGNLPETLQVLRGAFGDTEKGSVRFAVWDGVTPCDYSSRDNNWRRRTSQLLREAFIANLEPDAVIISSLFEGPADNSVVSIGECSRLFTVPILYDLIPLLYEDDYLTEEWGKAWYQEKLDCLKKADAWFSISESSRLEGIEHLGLNASRVTNISAAVDPKFRRINFGGIESEAILNKIGITRPFLLYAGATDSRKNLPRLLEAFASLPHSLRRSHQLVLAGGMPREHRTVLEQRLVSVGLGREEVIFTGQLTDDELVGLYNLCRGFVFPSLHEGFGLPALEAMSCGAATIGSNVSSVPEVIGIEDALFDPLSVGGMTERIARLLSDEEFRANLASACLERSKSFSWDCVAGRALKALEGLEACGHLSAIRRRSCSTSQLVERMAGAGTPRDADLLRAAAAMARIEPRQDERRKLYVDISELHRRDVGTGIQRVVRSLAGYLSGSSSRNFDVELVYATESEPYRHARGFSRKFLLKDAGGQADEVIDARDSDVFLVLDFHDQIAAAQASRYAYMRDRGVKIIFVVYDLLPVTLQNRFVTEHRANFERWLRVALAQDCCLCISRSVANELSAWASEHCPERLGKVEIVSFHLGADVEASQPSRGLPEDAERVLERISARPSFLMVGTVEPRKGHLQVLKAFEHLWRDGIGVNLVIVGRRGWMMDELTGSLPHHDAMGERLFWLEEISDEYLSRVYEAASCLIAASEGEGFGLPLVEAAKNKLPIIARDIPVFREVAGEHAYYFSGTRGEDLANGLRDWLRAYERQQHPSSDHMSWITWRESASQLLKAIGMGDEVKVQAP